MTTSRRAAPCRIICVGNRYASGDDAGPRVCDRLSGTNLPAGVEVIDGGLGGLNLAPVVEGARRIVFVDQVTGFGRPGEVLVLKGSDMVTSPPPSYGHADGLAYLLHALPVMCAGDLPEVTLVGVEGSADEQAIEMMARTAMRLVTDE